jgi:hypothetical protein
MKELVPEIERRFRGVGEGWARFTYGGSTGGWEALAVQILYPDDFNGCFAACPDPIDFRAYTLVNIYEDKNAYTYTAPHMQLARPGKRDYLGQITATLRDMNQYELALGTQGRSGQQWDNLGGRLFTGWAGRLSKAPVGQRDWRDRPQGGGILA